MSSKYFVSYSRSVKDELEKLIDLLRAAGHSVWWDSDIPAIADWWSTILTQIEACEIFIFVISEKSVLSPYCLAELDYALGRNRPILPLIIDDASKYDLPPQLTATRIQRSSYDGDTTKLLEKVTKSNKEIEWNKHRDVPIPRPLEPGKGAGTLTKEFQSAAKIAEDGHFDESVKRFKNISSLDNSEWGNECYDWILKIESYKDIHELSDNNATLKKAVTKWQTYIDKYGGDFDPFDLKTKLVKFPVLPPSSAKKKISRSSPSQQKTLSKSNLVIKKPSNIVVPDPFEWIEIPLGILDIEIKGTGKPIPLQAKKAKTERVTVERFAISKYPITNRQFQVFIDENGYDYRKYWTEKGWVYREEKPWSKPEGWRKGVKLDHPVVGVSWFEAKAYCQWLSQKLKSKINLPSDAQWQRAAQGNSRRAYPWGNAFIKTYANYNNQSYNTTATTPVQKYEAKSKSQFGVVDMVGNVWEWCSTIDDVIYSRVGSTFGRSAGFDKYIVHGGSWRTLSENYLMISYTETNDPVTRKNDLGFRIAINL